MSVEGPRSAEELKQDLKSLYDEILNLNDWWQKTKTKRVLSIGGWDFEARSTTHSYIMVSKDGKSIKIQPSGHFEVLLEGQGWENLPEKDPELCKEMVKSLRGQIQALKVSQAAALEQLRKDLRESMEPFLKV